MTQINLGDLDIDALRRRSGEKWTRFPADVLPAWVADMDFEIAEPIRLAVESRVANSDCGYPVSVAATGLPELLTERVAQRFAWEISPNQVELFTDVVQAIYFGLLALAQEGEGVVIQTPIYPPFIEATNATRRRAVLCPLVGHSDGFEIDFDQLRASVDRTTRILLLCNPHNPSGRCFSGTELEGLAELANANNLVIISDEIHADLVFEPHRHIPIASLSPDIAKRTVTLMSASKAFNIAGICMAFAVFGSEVLAKKFATIPRHARGAISALSIAAVTAAWTEGQQWLDEVMIYLRGNRDFLARHARAQWPQAHHVPPQATYLGWFDFRQYELSPNPQAYFLEHAKVGLSNGALFGDPGRGFVRLNFATSRRILEQITDRIDVALAAAK